MEEWIEEDNLAANTRLDYGLLKCIMRFLEQEHFITRVHVREKDPCTVVTHGGQISMRGGKVHTFATIDYLSFVDSIRLRIHLIRSYLCNELETIDHELRYICSQSFESKKSNPEYIFEPAVSIRGTDIYYNNKSETDYEIDSSMISENYKRPSELSTRKIQICDLIVRFNEQLEPITDQLSKLNTHKTPNCGTFENWIQKISLNNKTFSDTKNKITRFSTLESTKRLSNSSLRERSSLKTLNSKVPQLGVL
jgi:hypothetical protein